MSLDPDISASARPHCRTPEACVAKGAGHCRGCGAVDNAAKRFADPAAREAVRQRLIQMNRDPATRVKQAAGLKKNKAAMKEFRRTAREKLARANSDPIIVARREAGKLAALPRTRATLARNLAAELGIPVLLVPEYRTLRRRHKLQRSEALRILRASHPQAFASLDTHHRAAAARSCGPAPAIGMPGRAAWTRRVNAAQTGAEV